jgi:hypothetical protein
MPANSYSTVNDFSISNNPANAWSYGYRTALNAPFTAFTQSGQPWSGINAWSQNAGGACCAMVARNVAGATRDYAGQITHPVDLLNVHPGPGG